MGFVAPLLPFLASTVGGAVANKLFAPKPKTEPTPPVPTIAATTGSSAQATAEGAAARVRKRAARRSVDTILTGARGLGELPAENRGVKTLLGYMLVLGVGLACLCQSISSGSVSTSFLL